MITETNVTADELAALLRDVQIKGAAIHTTVRQDSPTSGTIVAHPKVGFISVTVKAGYNLAPDGTLTVLPDHGEDQIRQQLEADLAQIRAEAKA